MIVVRSWEGLDESFEMALVTVQRSPSPSNSPETLSSVSISLSTASGGVTVDRQVDSGLQCVTTRVPIDVIVFVMCLNST